jgi:molecular chaperone DnaK
VLVHVLQGESEMATYNKTLGKFELVGIPPAPRGVPQIEVSFDIDANGIINVSAKDNATGNEQQIRIEGGSGLKQDEIDRMIRDAEAHAGEAAKLKELVDARNNAEALAYQIEKSLNENREKLDSGLAGTVEGRIMELRGVLESGDVADIKAKTDALQQAWTEAAQALYANASASEAAGGSAGRPSDDEVVEDAEYEVVDE